MSPPEPVWKLLHCAGKLGNAAKELSAMTFDKEVRDSPRGLEIDKLNVGVEKEVESEEIAWWVKRLV